ncbi:CRIB domain-containing protein RIC10-like [Panicum miliaceum]|uniref:CRIB domain-containing protein RIC10-like n=1 Tax=Panicum miliaceum TaxID=4540 RepID=A0A3L6Q7J9_PANMI|nr:CRIB domain-containing protein RIC10-like [Panicum miliaceum]
MAYKVKGFFKGLKVISRIFVAKEHEMEIGYPTDVKHVAHIGWDSATGNASPSWMNGIMASPNFSSLGNFAASTGATWASQDFGAVSEGTGRQESATCPDDVPRPLGKPEDGSPTAPSASMEELASPPPAADEADTAVGVAADGTQ